MTTRDNDDRGRWEQRRRPTRPRFLPPTPRLARFVWGLAFVELLLTPILGCDPFHTNFDDDEAPAEYRAAKVHDPPVAGEELLVMTWNVKFAGGRIDFFFDCHGDRALMDEAEVLDHLEGLAAKIRQVDPDIVMLQEVDVASKRCAYVDMLQWLLDHTDLNYGVYASHWRADYIPSDGLGPMDSGNAIMSRWPLADSERIALPLIDEQDGLTQYFYLRRNVLKTRVVMPDLPPVWVLNVHTEAFSTDGTKKKHIDGFKAEMDALADAGQFVIGGGDLNALPPGASQLEGFEDSVCVGEFEADDYTGETDWLIDLYDDYAEAIPLQAYLADEDRYYTHTTDKDGFWNRRLDYLFTNSTWRDGLVHQSIALGGVETMPLSDHAPVTAKVKLP